MTTLSSINGKPQDLCGFEFYRTCEVCYNSDSCEKIFKGRCFVEVTDQGKVAFKKYILPVSDYSPNLLKASQQSFFQRLQTFLDNFDAFQVDINEAVLAGFFRSFGVIRDSVDFFVALGEHLKDKLGIDKETEKFLFSKESGLSPETIHALRDVIHASPLEVFQKAFPTGEDSQKACSNFLGIKHEPNTPFKRVLEEFGAAGPFGPLWMAISAAGQIAVESGLISAKEKPFYEIALALFSHKAARIGKNIPKASEVEKLSKSLELSIDLSKVSSGSSMEIQKASHTVEKFLDVRDLNSPKTGNIMLDTTKILPTQARNVCGWRVGQEINNRTILGDVPTWSTVRARHWKNEALKHRQGLSLNKEMKYIATEENISRMERGLAPQYELEGTGKIESIERHHEPPQREGGLFDFEELRVKEHMDKDPHRAGLIKGLKGDSTK